MPAPTTPTLTITQGGDPVTAGEAITAGTVLLISLTGSAIPSPAPTAGFTWAEVASPAPTASFTWQEV